MTKHKNFSGKKFGKLTAIKEMPLTEGKKWLFECDCGNKLIALKYNVTTGHTKSCGCLKTKHGLYYTRLHRIWAGIKERCFNKNDIHYKRYGGRGITMCNSWKENFICFYNWAIENGYKDTLTIDRINNDYNYCPENCRWASKEQQARNRKNNKFFNFNKETHCASEWEKILGFPRCTIYNRTKLGWNFEKIVTTPIKGKNHDNNSILHR